MRSDKLLLRLTDEEADHITALKWDDGSPAIPEHVNNITQQQPLLLGITHIVMGNLKHIQSECGIPDIEELGHWFLGMVAKGS